MQQTKSIRWPFFAFILLASILTIPSCRTENETGSILVICSSADYGWFTPEILRAEGITHFDTVSLERATDMTFSPVTYSLIILSSGDAHPDLLDKLLKYVYDGGKLISVVPRQEGWKRFYAIPQAGNEGHSSYVYIDTTALSGAKLSGHRMRVHAERALYEAADPRVIAWFGGDRTAVTHDPAVITVKEGRGSLTLFMYNLPANIVLTRQGNPMAAGIEKDGIPGLRAMDLFTDGWVDIDCNTMNPADEQMHLLSQIIEHTALSEIPLPRTWYFPDSLKCLVTLTNDGEFRDEKDFEAQFRDINAAGASMTLYVLETGKVSGNWAQQWTDKGFEIAGHPDNTREAGSPVWAHVDSALEAKMKEISSLYGLGSKTVVNHWFVWCGTDADGKQEFSAQAQIEANHGILLDANYAHYDNNATQGHFLGVQGSKQGNYTGSGLVMKFASSKGNVIPVWQHLNNVYDQQYMENHDPGGFFEAFRGLMDRSIDEDVWSTISIKSHNDEYSFSKEPLLRMISYARSRGIPVWTASRLADFLDKRDRSYISGLSFSGTALSFSFNVAGSGNDPLSLIIPSDFASKKAGKIIVNGFERSYERKILRGKEYVILMIRDAGANRIRVTYN